MGIRGIGATKSPRLSDGNIEGLRNGDVELKEATRLPRVAEGHFLKTRAHRSWSECPPTLAHPHVYAFLAEPSSSPGEPEAQKGSLTAQNLPNPASSWRARPGSALRCPGSCAVQAQREKGLGWGNKASVRLRPCWCTQPPNAEPTLCVDTGLDGANLL